MNNQENEQYSRRIEGPTPCGGAYAILYFFDSNGQSTTEDKAVTAIGVEFDQNGNQLQSTNFVMKPNLTPEDDSSK